MSLGGALPPRGRLPLGLESALEVLSQPSLATPCSFGLSLQRGGSSIKQAVAAGFHPVAPPARRASPLAAADDDRHRAHYASGGAEPWSRYCGGLHCSKNAGRTGAWPTLHRRVIFFSARVGLRRVRPYASPSAIPLRGAIRPSPDPEPRGAEVPLVLACGHPMIREAFCQGARSTQAIS